MVERSSENLKVGITMVDKHCIGNDGMGIAILICFGKQVSDGHIYSDSVCANSSAAF